MEYCLILMELVILPPVRKKKPRKKKDKPIFQVVFGTHTITFN